MTRPTLPDICDICGKEIDSEQQYCAELFQGRTTFSDDRVRAKKRLDICHPCFMKICENGYKPNWLAEIKNVNYKPGSKLASEKFFTPKPEPELQTKIEA